MDQLTELAIKYKTDKWGKKHHYIPVYYEMFKDRRESVKKVLEIGIAEGAGLFMFRDFFPNATIYGGEIDPKRVKLMEGQERIKVFECDQSFHIELKELIDKTGQDIDLVIDDGSHKPEDQMFSQTVIFPLLKEGAIYVIEDVADASIMKKLEGNTELVRVGNRYDDQLIIIKK